MVDAEKGGFAFTPFGERLLRPSRATYQLLWRHPCPPHPLLFKNSTPFTFSLFFPYIYSPIKIDNIVNM